MSFRVEREISVLPARDFSQEPLEMTILRLEMTILQLETTNIWLKMTNL